MDASDLPELPSLGPYPEGGTHEARAAWLQRARDHPDAAGSEDAIELHGLRLTGERQAEIIARLHAENGALRKAEIAEAGDSVRRLHDEVRAAVAEEFERQRAALEERLLGITTPGAGSPRDVEALHAKAVLLAARCDALQRKMAGARRA